MTLSADSFAHLYRQHSYAVLRRCRALLRDEMDAQDAMHDVFARLLENPTAYGGRSSVGTFLYRVATNLCLNHIRDSKARAGDWAERVRVHLEASEPTNLAAQTEARQLVDGILAEQDATTAAIALYHFVDGLPQGEVADLVGVSRVTVNQRLQQLRTMTRQDGGAHATASQ